MTPAAESYAAKLSKCYQEDIKFLPLSLVDKNSERLHTLTVEEEAQGSDVDMTLGQFCSRLTRVSGEHVLIKGGPGYGKTSLAKQICKKWQEKLVLTNYLVIMLQLGDSRLQELKSKAELFDLCNISSTSTSTCTCLETCKDLLDEIDESNGTNVLFILEGYDELTNREHIVNQLIFREIYPCATVLVTTRPWATPNACFPQRYELAGHPRSVIKKCIEKYARKIPVSIKACLSTPIFLKMIIDVYETSKEPLDSPFDVYEKLVVREGNLVDFLTRKESVSNESDKFKSLTKRAAFMVIKSKLLPSTDDINEIERAVTERTALDTEELLLHSSIQEFLAACFVIDMDYSKFFKLTHRRFSHFLIFLAGFIHNHKHGEVCVDSIKNYFDSVAVKKRSRNMPDKTVTIHTMSFFCLLHELQDTDIVKDVFKAERHIVIERTSPLPTPYDFYALGWCISNSECTWELGFTVRYLLPEHLEALAGGLRSLGLINVLNISLNPFGTEGLKNALEGMALENLKYLNVRGVGLEVDACTLLEKYIPNMSHLEKFLIHDNRIAKGGHMPLMSAICKTESIKEASFSDLDAQECCMLMEASRLERLELWQLDHASIVATMDRLQCNCTLKGLEIYQSEICHESIAHLKDALAKNTSLESLKLVNCNIDNATANTIAEAVKSSRSLCKISLDDNWIYDDALLRRMTNSQRKKVKYFADRNMLHLQ